MTNEFSRTIIISYILTLNPYGCWLRKQGHQAYKTEQNIFKNKIMFWPGRMEVLYEPRMNRICTFKHAYCLCNTYDPLL